MHNALQQPWNVEGTLHNLIPIPLCSHKPNGAITAVVWLTF